MGQRRTLGMKLAWGVISTLAFVACGSSDSEPFGNSNAVCAAGETRVCTGPGACAGGQQCTSGQWSVCECGSTGGSGGGSTGGSAGSGSSGSGGTGNSSAGGTGGNAGSSATGGSSNDAGQDADPGDPPGPNDDPCPTEEIDLNCSTQCGAGPDPACAGPDLCNMQVTITSESQLPFIVRLPDKMINTGCSCLNGGQQPIFVLTMKIGAGIPYELEATVGAPWWVAGGPGNCLDTSGWAKGCSFFPSSISLAVATSYPNAASRNLIIDKVGAAACTPWQTWP
jgi:hypothetical protein